MKKILAAIGGFLAKLFTDLYTSAKKTFEAMPEQDKLAMIHGSGFVAVINEMLGQAPSAVYSAIRARFPNVSPEKIDEALFTACREMGLGEFTNSLSAIAALQVKINAVVDNQKLWGYVSHGLAVLFALAFGSKDLKVSAVSWLMQFVYETFFEKKAA